MTGIYRVDEQKQVGFWFLLEISKTEQTQVRKWCRDNCGQSSRMSGTLARGWEPDVPDRSWSWLQNIIGCYVIFWTERDATLFVLFHPIAGTGYPYGYIV